MKDNHSLLQNLLTFGIQLAKKFEVIFVCNCSGSYKVTNLTRFLSNPRIHWTWSFRQMQSSLALNLWAPPTTWTTVSFVAWNDGFMVIHRSDLLLLIDIHQILHLVCTVFASLIFCARCFTFSPDFSAIALTHLIYCGRQYQTSFPSFPRWLQFLANKFFEFGKYIEVGRRQIW